MESPSYENKAELGDWLEKSPSQAPKIQKQEEMADAERYSEIVLINEKQYSKQDIIHACREMFNVVIGSAIKAENIPLRLEKDLTKEQLPMLIETLTPIGEQANSGVNSGGGVFIVIKEYAGIKEGMLVYCTDRANINYMLSRGYWKKQ